ncbi:MAG: glutaredoxin 3 [Candidatus Magasanikbacteria bacterium CG_4_10_14_0_2_um_filter_33_14]|uniref:Glutaredoxin 3 n=1 Tax=Candidatus Magasanikbacteria bacterium CG_4_10_14_0_2_um_filter_33_14 TaxID=1974636 RepID=A0A2M7VC03_9BACT|nr:MAG: glutaredoxin 3 [Candidatus Magasanikbacteria bacterium CG_4_10_14_0_2_um_filter_33_14]
MFKIYTTNYCAYCKKAKELLDSLDIPFEEIDITEDTKVRDEASKKAGGWMTVPMIFRNEEFIGGFDDLYKLHLQGKLKH